MINRLILLLTLAAAVISCSKETGGGGQLPLEREVEMNFLLPGASTRADSDEEKEIKNLTILVFNGSGDDAVYQYSRYAWRKTGTVNPTYTTTMKIGSGLTIYFAANRNDINSLLETKGIVEGESNWGRVREALIMDTPNDGNLLSKGLPMWGMITGRSISEQAENHLGTIQLIRSVASIDIYMLADNFELTEGHAVFAANKGHMAYDPAKMTDNNNILRAHTPYSPDGFTTSVNLNYTLTPSDGGSIVNKFYVYENSTPLTGATGGNRPTKVILKGKPGNSTAGETYYPLSLRTKIGESYVKKQVMRNNKYSIFIQNVHGDGYPGIDEAKDADDVNWDYDVIEWDDNEDGEIIIDGTKFFFRDRSSVTLPRSAGTTTRVNIRTNFDLDQLEMKFTSGEAHDSHPRFDTRLVKKEDDPNSSYDYILITAKQDYGTANNPARLNLSVGRISLNINIEQLDLSPGDWNDGGNIGVIVQ